MNRYAAVTCAFVGLVTAGCAGQSPVGDATVSVDTVTTSGFLQDYSILREGSDGEAALVYWNDSADFGAYQTVIVDPVTIWVGSDSSLNDVEPDQRQKLADEFYAAIIAALEPDYTITDQIGPNTMRIRVALTDAEASSPALDTISTYVPQARLLQSVLTLGSDTAGFVGEATAEAEVRDAQTDLLLAAGVDRRAGTKSLSGGTFDRWGDVRRSFDAWSSSFASNLRSRAGGG